MSLIPNNAKKIEVDGATVDFFTYEENDLIYYIFDTSACTPPDPMVNAMMGLQLLDDTKKRLVMINHSVPNALFVKISHNFDYEINSVEGEIKIEFKYKEGTALETDFEDNQCNG